MTDQSYYWTPEWQAAELEAQADISAGRTRTFLRVDEAIAWLLTDETEPHDDPELVDVTTLPDDVPDGEVDPR